MNILYLSCHEILEYDELKLFTEMGHKVYSLGAYTHPYGDEGRKRPGIPDMPYEPHFTELATRYGKELHPEMVEHMDMIMIMHTTEFLTMNDKVIRDFLAKGKRVVWRSIGQSVPAREEEIRPYRKAGMEVVRYSPAERSIPDNVGSDAMIRFYKDPLEFDGWTGAQQQLINFTQTLKGRARFTGYEIFSEVSAGFPTKVYGPGNEDLGDLWGGMLSYQDQLQALRDNRVYFYHGTYPASYTLSFIEALMTGIPVVAVGPAWGNGRDFRFQRTYEIPEIIQNGTNGFWSDDVEELRKYVKMLMDDHELAKQIGIYGRRRAIELFGKHNIRERWEKFFERNE